MKQNLLFVALVLVFRIGFAQGRQRIDSLKHELTLAINDTSRVLILEGLCSDYASYSFDSSNLYGKQGLALAEKATFKGKSKNFMWIIKELLCPWGSAQRIGTRLQSTPDS